MLVFVFFFFFKQKTAYEMRISDWSSDVCSSDLPADALGEGPRRGAVRELRIPQDQGGHIDRGEAGRVDGRAGTVGGERERKDRQRIETGGRERRTPHHPRAPEADGQADGDADDELEDDDAENSDGRVLGPRSARDQDKQDDRRRVVEA